MQIEENMCLVYNKEKTAKETEKGICKPEISNIYKLKKNKSKNRQES